MESHRDRETLQTGVRSQSGWIHLAPCRVYLHGIRTTLGAQSISHPLPDFFSNVLSPRNLHHGPPPSPTQQKTTVNVHKMAILPPPIRKPGHPPPPRHPPRPPHHQAPPPPAPPPNPEPRQRPAPPRLLDSHPPTWRLTMGRTFRSGKCSKATMIVVLVQWRKSLYGENHCRVESYCQPKSHCQP